MIREGTTTRTLLRAGAAMLLAALSLSGCGGPSEQQNEAEERFPVETVVIERGTVSPVLAYSGTVLPEKKALLGASIQGSIEKFHVDVGDKVSEGDLLVELASEQLTQAEAKYVAAEKDWHRMTDLLSKGAVTQQAFDRADATYQATKAAYEMVLESARIRAPFDGVITRRFFDEGEVYVMMAVSTPSPAIIELSKFDHVKVEIDVAEHERALARTGLSATVRVETLPGRSFEGRVTRIDPGLDRSSHSSRADITVDNPQHVLMPGMFADVALTLAEKEGILLTRDAIIRQEGTGSFYVYAVEDSVARRHKLTLGGSYGDRVEVLGGVEPGDVVVTAGRYNLHDGARVYRPGPESVPPDSGAGGSEAERASEGEAS
jgi:membrane fusion protein (multidrug efflux system)